MNLCTYSLNVYFLWAKSHKGIFLMHWIIFPPFPGNHGQLYLAAARQDFDTAFGYSHLILKRYINQCMSLIINEYSFHLANF